MSEIEKLKQGYIDWWNRENLDGGVPYAVNDYVAALEKELEALKEERHHNGIP